MDSGHLQHTGGSDEVHLTLVNGRAKQYNTDLKATTLKLGRQLSS